MGNKPGNVSREITNKENWIKDSAKKIIKIIADRIANTLWAPFELELTVENDAAAQDRLNNFIKDIDLITIMNSVEKDLSMEGIAALTVDSIPYLNKIYLSHAKVVNQETGIVEGRPGIVKITISKQITDKITLEETYSKTDIVRKAFNGKEEITWDPTWGNQTIKFDKQLSQIPVIVFYNKPNSKNEAISDTANAQIWLNLYPLTIGAQVRELKTGGTKLIKFTDGTPDSVAFESQMADQFEKTTMELISGSSLGDGNQTYQFVQAAFNQSLPPLIEWSDKVLSSIFIASGYHEVGFAPNLSFQQTRGEIRFENRQEEITVKSKIKHRFESLKNLLILVHELKTGVLLEKNQLKLEFKDLSLELQEQTNDLNPTPPKPGAEAANG